MKRFQVGDQVRVASLSSSPWQNSRGTIIEILESHPLADSGTLQECAVKIGDKRCWFMSAHLARSVPARFVRFFRAEVLDRWRLDPDKVSLLNGDHQELVDLLCDEFSFAIRRAEAEADEFYAAFNARMACATDSPVQQHHPESYSTKTAA
jgi:hypothetical protein